MAKKDVKESAKEVRKVLKTRYPGIKFSVRAKRFAGGSSVDISWTDGPTEHEVSAATAHLKGYDNGYYNDYIITYRHTSREVMEAAATAAAKYYEVPVPEIVGGDNPYCEDLTRVNGFNDLDRAEPICDKIHRAVWKTNVYNVELIKAFRDAYPC